MLCPKCRSIRIGSEEVCHCGFNYETGEGGSAEGAALPSPPESPVRSAPVPAPVSARGHTILTHALVALVFLVVGYFVGREHLKHELRASVQDAAQQVMAGLSSAFNGVASSPPSEGSSSSAVHSGTSSSLPSPRAATSDERPLAGSGDGVITVRILRKEFKGLDLDSMQLSERIFFDLEHRAVGLRRPARAIKGTLRLQDLFGETKLRVNWTIDEPLEPGATVRESGVGFEYNQFESSHQWVRATDAKDMQAVFRVSSILYQDGTREDF